MGGADPYPTAWVASTDDSDLNIDEVLALNGSARHGAENVLQVAPLCEASVVESIKARYDANLCFSAIDRESLISLNPYAWGPLSSPAVMAFYKGKPELAPHISTQVQNILQGIREDGRNRSVVITGESGGSSPPPVFMPMYGNHVLIW